MAAVDRSVASLRIFGDSLQPDEISKLLGCAPTKSYLKGAVEPSKHNDVVRRTGMWSLQARPREPEDLDSQIVELLNQLPADLLIWERLSIEYKLDLFCGLFMKETDEGLEISADTLKALGDRKIRFGVCIYAPITRESNGEA
jgi:Domain of unknown function (DUF4279)